MCEDTFRCDYCGRPARLDELVGSPRVHPVCRDDSARRAIENERWQRELAADVQARADEWRRQMDNLRANWPPQVVEDTDHV